jgi:uncharacterized protein YndB with AHSA1/START domain
MAEMHHEIEIQAPPRKVYDALATQEGLRGWWTADSAVQGGVGGTAEFGFSKRAMVFRMRVLELDPPKRVTWECSGDHPEWKGTRLTWEIWPKDGGAILHFTHGGWWAVSRFFSTCNSTWGELMYRLKGYAEGKSPGPHWTE